MSRSSLFLPLFLIIFGAVWFLKTTDILPATSTIVSAGMVVAGICGFGDGRCQQAVYRVRPAAGVYRRSGISAQSILARLFAAGCFGNDGAGLPAAAFAQRHGAL